MLVEFFNTVAHCALHYDRPPQMKIYKLDYRKLQSDLDRFFEYFTTS